MSVHWPVGLFWDFNVATVKVEEEAAVGQKVQDRIYLGLCLLD